MTRPVREFTPGTAEDVTDLELLPRRFDLFAAEMRQRFELLDLKLPAALDRIASALGDIAERLGRLESEQHDTKQRVHSLEHARKPNGKPKNGA